ncbi:MAG TPA: hypothetical protein VF043_39370 [Ktedonobacteraceae bacterium]
MVAGSTGRGTSDRYSDLETDVYYSAAPTEEERRATAERSGGTFLDFDEGEDEWAEEISIQSCGRYTSISHGLFCSSLCLNVIYSFANASIERTFSEKNASV